MQVNTLMVIVMAVMATTTAAQLDGSCMINVNEDIFNQYIEEGAERVLNQYIETGLDEDIEEVVNSMLADEPVVKTVTIGRDNLNNLKLTFEELSATISLADPTQPQTSSNNLLAYRPQFSDYHSSNLAGLFINLPGVFPCTAGHVIPPCARFTLEEEGFNDGKAILEAADSGNNWKVFSSTEEIPTYGMAFQDCPKFTTDCFPVWYGTKVVCLLPREYCG